MKLIIEIGDDNSHEVTVIGDDRPVIVCHSINRMAEQIVILSEVISGVEVDSLYFADVTYLDNDRQ